MDPFGSSSSIDDQSSSLHSDFGPSMSQDRTSKPQKLPLLSFKYHPGFFCFFEQYTNRQGWTFHECYDKVFQSHHEMNKIKRPTEQIAHDEDLQKTEKIRELMHRAQKDKVFALYVKRPDGELQCNVVSHEDRRILQINKLKKKLEKLEQIKAKVIEQKKKQFQLKQIQRSKEQELELESILNEKERRAKLIRKIQFEALERKIQRQKEKAENPGFFSSALGKCQIM